MAIFNCQHENSFLIEFHKLTSKLLNIIQALIGSMTPSPRGTYESKRFYDFR